MAFLLKNTFLLLSLLFLNTGCDNSKKVNVKKTKQAIPLTFLRSISGYGDTGYGTTGYFSNIVIAGDATIAGEDASTTTLTPSNIILGCTTGAGYTNTLTPFSSEIADNNSLYTVRTIYNSITLTNNEGIPSSLRITAKSISADYWQIHPQGGIVATNLQLYNYSGGEREYIFQM